MTWTYTGDPSASPADETRWLLGDTDEARPLVSDEEIAWALGQTGADPRRAAAKLAGGLAVTYGRRANVSVGSLSISYADRAAWFRSLAAELVPARIGGPVLGGGGPTYLGPTDSGEPGPVRPGTAWP